MKHLPRLLGLSFLSLLSVTAAACNEVESGEMGLVDFVPDDCGQSGCDLDDGLAVGATTDVYLEPAGGGTVDDLHIESSAPWIAEVLDYEPGSSPRAVIGANAEGYVDLLAVDRYGYVIDFVTIHVVAADEIELDVQGNIATGEVVTIDATALADGWPVMGRIEYTVVTDAEMAAGIGSQDVGDGRFTIQLPAGEHDLFVSTATAWRTIHFSVK
jgi:hypothetical protein